MTGLVIGNLELDALTTTVFVIATVFFLGSFIFVSRTNDMIGALESLGRRNEDGRTDMEARSIPGVRPAR